MLRELHISNLAVIEDVSIEFDEGFNCFTGQTGAGKSLILGAFEVLLGLRATATTDLIRPGAEEGRVTGVFEVRDPRVAGQIATVLDDGFDPDDQLLITRKLFRSGRSSVSINGRPATAAMARAAGELLVDVHGQHDHQFLLKPSNQLSILDAFARCTDQRDRYVRDHGRLGKLLARREALSASGTLRHEQLDLYEFQADEIDAADPVDRELEELQARHALLGNVQRIRRDAGQAHAALCEAEGSAIERLQMIAQVLSELGDLDDPLRPLAEQIRTATLSIQDGAFELRRYLDRLEVDPGEMGEVEERLNVLNRLVSKYGKDALPGDDPVTAVLTCRARIEQQIRQLRGDNEDLQSIDQDIALLRKDLTDLGAALSATRRAAAERLAPLVEAELADLGMVDASFLVAFDTVDPQDTTSTPNGFERIEILIRTNPGQPARPLRRIASGGELSRIMLALKTILAGADRISVLVFDEIDANIGGRLGTVIGTKLRKLVSNGSERSARHQVLCITHLPQIAAFADRHLRIEKGIEGRGKARKTTTTVTALDARTRIDELAEMLAGRNASKTTRRQAREMLESATI